MSAMADEVAGAAPATARGNETGSGVRPETAERLGALIRDFAGANGHYYARTFAYMMEAPGYRFTLNWAAGLLGPIWFGARGLWSWLLTGLILETAAYIQIGRGLFGDLGRDARERANSIAATLELREQQIEAAEKSGASSLEALQRAAESLRAALAQAEAAAEAAGATGITYLLLGLVMLAVFKLGQAALANWALEGQFTRWRSDPRVAHGFSAPRAAVSAAISLWWSGSRRPSSPSPTPSTF